MFSKIRKKLSVALDNVIQEQIDQVDSLVNSLYEEGQYEQAIEYATRSAELCRELVGEHHLSFAESINTLGVLYYSIGDYAAAEPFYKQAMGIKREALGEQHPDFAESLINLAHLYYSKGDIVTALPPYKQAMEIYRFALGEQHPTFVESLDRVAAIYNLIGDKASALPFYKQLLEIKRKTLGEQHPDFALSLNNLAALQRSLGNYAAAEPLYKQAIEIRRKILGEQHPDLASSLSGLAALYDSIGNYTASEPLHKQIIEIRREALGERHTDFASSLYCLAALYVVTGNYIAAEPLYKQIIEIKRDVLGERHQNFAASLDDLAVLYVLMGNYTDAEPLYKQIIEIRREALGEQHPDFANSLSKLATLYMNSRGDYVAAEPLYKQALAIYRLTLGEQHPDFIGILNNLAAVDEIRQDVSSIKEVGEQIEELNSIVRSLDQQGQHEEAIKYATKSVDLTRQFFGEQHPDFALSLNNLAMRHYSIGNYAAALPLYKQALEINRLSLGEQHPSFATSLNNLAVLYDSMGDYTAAEPLYQQAMEIRRKTLGEQHPSFAESLINLAGLYYSMGDNVAALLLYTQAVEINRQALGEQHPSFALSINSLAAIYDSMGDHEAALPLHKQALEIKRKALGEQHPSFALSLHNLAVLYYSIGDYASALPLYKQAVEIRRTVLGPQHPDLAVSLRSLASLFAATNNEAEAMRTMEQSLAINERMIGFVFSISSEKQRTAYLNTIRAGLNGFLSLVSQSLSDSREAVCAALSVVLRRKAIEAEALATQRDAVLGGKYPEVAPILQEINMLRTQIAQKTLTGPGKEGLQNHHQMLAEWNSRKERLEAEVARQVPEMNIEKKLRSIDHQVVSMALPMGTMLVEFTRFNVFDFKTVVARDEWRWKPARYIAFVVPAGEPEAVEMIDLGEAEPIDRMIATFREIITGEEENNSKRGLGAMPKSAWRAMDEGIGVRLRDAVFTPLMKAIGSRKRLLISPDGDLTRLPFEALPLNDGRYLIDEYRISYLGTGRDVIRFEFKSNREPSRSLVVADPDFNFGVKVRHAGTAIHVSYHSSDFQRNAIETFERLPDTRFEGEKIAAMLDAELWTEGAVLDARLKKCKSPRVLHVATHGFFLEDQKRHIEEERSGFVAMNSESGIERLTGAHLENPLLRSGLALAGVNTWLEKGELMEDAEDGLLTAEDVTGLDLLDTELVVLSACETGLGEVHVGEGVFGLRRAFVLAGAKSLVMSLWKVPDEQTRELMEDFYRRILSGEPRAAALREAQLAMKAKHPEPLYWGAFICQGDPSPLPVKVGQL